MYSSKPKLLPFADWCASIGVGRTKGRDILNRGDVEAVHIDGKTLVVVESSDAYIAALPRYKAGRKVADNKAAA